MDEIYCLKFVIACCERSIKEVLKVEGKFSLDLFNVLLKKNIYEVLSGEEWVDNVKEMVDSMSINYDFVDELENDESLMEKIEFDLDAIKEMNEEEKQKLIDNFNLEELIEQNSENLEITIDIPISLIIDELKKMMDNGELELDYNPRDILRDINIIEEIWENWSPYVTFMIQAKNMADYMLDNITL